MKKRISLILVLCMALALLAGCGSSNSSAPDAAGDDEDAVSFDIDSTDMLTQHTVFLTAEEEGYREYHIYYYGKDTHVLRAISVQIQYDKTEGMTQEYVNTYDPNEAYPGFDTLSFASKQIVDDGDFFTVIMTFDELEDPDNLAAMERNGLITTTGNTEHGVSADGFMDDLRSQGCEEVDITDDAYLTLHF